MDELHRELSTEEADAVLDRIRDYTRGPAVPGDPGLWAGMLPLIDPSTRFAAELEIVRARFAQVDPAPAFIDRCMAEVVRLLLDGQTRPTAGPTLADATRWVMHRILAGRPPEG